MRNSTSVLAMTLAVIGCSQSNTMTSPETPIEATGDAAVEVPAALPADLAADLHSEDSLGEPNLRADGEMLPGFDRAAANIIGSGKFETATFALG